MFSFSYLDPIFKVMEEVEKFLNVVTSLEHTLEERNWLVGRHFL